MLLERAKNEQSKSKEEQMSKTSRDRKKDEAGKGRHGNVRERDRLEEKSSNLGRIELEVQKRVTAVLSSAGLSEGVLSREVLYMLPPDFVRNYVTLFYRGLREDMSGNGSARIDGGKQPAKSSGKNARTGAMGKRYVREHWVVKDEDMMKFRGRIDRKLLALGVEIESELRSGASDEKMRGSNRRRCEGLGCKKWVNDEWRFCPSCGNDLGAS